MFFLMSFVFILLKNRLKLRIGDNASLLKYYFLLVVYQVTVNVTWFLFLNETDLIKRVAYYVFNFLMVIECVVISKSVGTEKTIDAVAKGCFYATIVSCIGVFFGRSWSSTRRSGFFNNPNQLGYFCLLLIMFCALFPDSMSKRRKWFIYIVAFFSLLQSASKAAFAGVLLIIALNVIITSKESTKTTLFLKLFGLILFAVFSYMFFFTDNSFIFSNRALLILRNRILLGSKDADNNLWTGRGYGRIAEMPSLYYLFGMGEGAYNRFQIMYGVEANTTYATIFVSYGIVGLLGYIGLFYYFLKSRLKYRSLLNLFCLSGAFFYFASHNALRNTFLWMILACLAITNKYCDERGNIIERIYSDEWATT